jgi:hypothetical protein
MKKWEDCPREDLNMIPTMEAAGWTPRFNQRDQMCDRTSPESVPHDAVSFKKEKTYVWMAVHNKRIDWRTADLIDGYFKNHRWHKTLKEIKENGK